MGSINVTIDYKTLYDEITRELNNVKEKYNKLVEEFETLKSERDYWKEQYVNADKLNQFLSETPGVKEPGNTPMENRIAQGKMTGKWTSYDKMENFDIFS